MATLPIVLEVDKIRSTDGSTEISVSEINNDSSSSATVNLVENDLGITRNDSGDILYKFGETPSASLNISGSNMVLIDTSSLSSGSIIMWNGSSWVDSDLIIETI